MSLMGRCVETKVASNRLVGGIPGSASKDSLGPSRGPLRVFAGGGSVVVGIVPIGAPFPVVADQVQAAGRADPAGEKSCG